MTPEEAMTLAPSTIYEMTQDNPEFVKDLPADIASILHKKVYDFRRKLDTNSDKMKKTERIFSEHALNTYLSDADKVTTKGGTYTETEKKWLEKPEGGWSDVYTWVEKEILAGKPADEVLTIFQKRLTNSYFEDVEPDDMPAGFVNKKEPAVRFTPKRGAIEL